MSTNSSGIPPGMTSMPNLDLTRPNMSSQLPSLLDRPFQRLNSDGEVQFTGGQYTPTTPTPAATPNQFAPQPTHFGGGGGDCSSSNFTTDGFMHQQQVPHSVAPSFTSPMLDHLAVMQRKAVAAAAQYSPQSPFSPPQRMSQNQQQQQAFAQRLPGIPPGMMPYLDGTFVPQQPTSRGMPSEYFSNFDLCP